MAELPRAGGANRHLVVNSRLTHATAGGAPGIRHGADEHSSAGVCRDNRPLQEFGGRGRAEGILGQPPEHQRLGTAGARPSVPPEASPSPDTRHPPDQGSNLNPFKSGPGEFKSNLNPCKSGHQEFKSDLRKFKFLL